MRKLFAHNKRDIQDAIDKGLPMLTSLLVKYGKEQKGVDFVDIDIFDEYKKTFNEAWSIIALLIDPMSLDNINICKSLALMVSIKLRFWTLKINDPYRVRVFRNLITELREYLKGALNDCLI